MFLMGITIHPLGSFKSITSTSCRSLKLVPALMLILRTKTPTLIMTNDMIAIHQKMSLPVGSVALVQLVIRIDAYVANGRLPLELYVHQVW